MKIWKALVVASALALALTGCAVQRLPRQPRGDRLSVQVAFYPFQFVAERVGGDAGDGHQPHRAGDRAARPRTDPPPGRRRWRPPTCVVYQSGFQPAVDTAVEQAKPARVVDTASFLTMLSAAADGAEEPATGD